MSGETVTIYRQRAERFRLELDGLTRKIQYSGLLRLVLFVITGFFVYKSFQHRFHGYDMVAAIGSLILFALAVSWANALNNRSSFVKKLIVINENEINISNGIASVLDDGSRMMPGKGFTNDLSVFGKNSLFHLLNRAGSDPGKRFLAKKLETPFLHSEAIIQYQEATQDLSGEIEFRQTLLATTLLFEEGETILQLKAGLLKEDFLILKNSFWSIMAYAWPLLGFLLLIYSVITDNYRYLLVFGLLGLFVLSFVVKKISKIYHHISKRSYLFSQYAGCFHLLETANFRNGYLIKKQKEIAEASTAFKQLSGLTGKFDLRLSLFSFFINALFLWDLLCARGYLKWNEKYQEKLGTWFDTMGEFECLCSIACFRYNHPSYTFPVFSDTALMIEATGMGHPLMKKETAVVNDLLIAAPEKLHLITGSNMSGKSTFLRTVGLNMILAQIGAPVFAERFVCRPVRFLTSFHHIDSLEESTSYFYAELKCLQEIIASLDAAVPALVLLDEVMRGTNSKDKHDGTALLIRKLITKDCLVMIATHDTELGILSETYPGLVANFCFESVLTENGLHFDFRKRSGVAQTKNATYLMQQMGIV
jgi:hypothetical protein